MFTIPVQGKRLSARFQNVCKPLLLTEPPFLEFESSADGVVRGMVAAVVGARVRKPLVHEGMQNALVNSLMAGGADRRHLRQLVSAANTWVVVQ